MSSLFQDCLGEQFSQLSPLVRQAHEGNIHLEGDVKVERGNLIAKLICQLFSMPPASQKCRLVVHGSHSLESMNWNRHFDQHPMDSHFYKDGSHLVEKLGPIHMWMALNVNEGTLTYTLSKTRIFGIPIPRAFSPKVVAVEQEHAKQYRFSVIVTMPIIGMLVKYGGDMALTPK